MTNNIKRWIESYMNDNAMKWVEDLINGPQNQAHERLRDGWYEERCCLGVGCDTYMRETGRGYWDGDVFYGGSGDDEDFSETHLPASVRDWLGLRSNGGRFHEPGDSSGFPGGCLTNLNDDKGFTLKEIGEFIRDHGDEVGLFV